MCHKIEHTKCSVCHTYGSAQHFDLFVFGSEGVDLCPSCRVIVCNQILDLTMSYLRDRRDAVLAKRRASEHFLLAADPGGEVGCEKCGWTGEE